MKPIEETEDYIIYEVTYPKGKGKAILCKTCDRVSYNSNDVDQKFCPCKGYHQNRVIK